MAEALEKEIQRLADETRGLIMDRHRGQNRSLAMVITKLDEARQWAITYGEEVGRLAVVDKGALLRAAATNAMDTTCGIGGVTSDAA